MAAKVERDDPKPNPLGEKIRRLRQVNHLSLSDLADKIDASRSFISQIEQGKTAPSLQTLKHLASALNCTVGSLVDDPVGPTAPTVAADQRPKIDRLRSGVTIESLTYPDIHKSMEPLLIVLDPGANSGPESYQHRGEEFIFVIGGRLLLQLNGEEYPLEEGGSAYFDSSRPHRFANPGTEKTFALWVITPPSF